MNLHPYLATLLCFWVSVSSSLAHATQPADKTVTLLFTNDVESAYRPIPAFWLDDLTMIGGIAEMTTLIKQLREREANTFLFDSGDIFTGSLAKLCVSSRRLIGGTWIDADTIVFGSLNSGLQRVSASGGVPT